MGGIGSGGSREGSGRRPVDGEPRSRISVTLPTWLLREIRKESERRDMSVSGYISELLERGIEN